MHKGIRLASARLPTALGQSDPADPAQINAVLAQLAAHLERSHAHLKHENAKIHAAVDARLPGGADHADEDHQHHLEAFSALRALGEALAVAGDAARPAILRRLYQRFALFMADDLQHMHEEETRLLPLIAKTFTAGEVAGIEHAIVSSIAPEVMIPFMKFMLGAATRSERIAQIETGWLTFAPRLQHTLEATEAIYRLREWSFEAGFRRFGWKRDAANRPSRRAAQRFGLSHEGIFRQATIVKGRNRDSAWHAAMDHEWPALKAAFETWLDPSNFDAEGRQRQRLTDLTAPGLVALDPGLA